MLPVVIMVTSGNKRISFLSSGNCLRGKKPKMVEYMFEPAQNEKKKILSAAGCFLCKEQIYCSAHQTDLTDTNELIFML